MRKKFLSVCLVFLMFSSFFAFETRAYEKDLVPAACTSEYCLLEKEETEKLENFRVILKKVHYMYQVERKEKWLNNVPYFLEYCPLP